MPELQAGVLQGASQCHSANLVGHLKGTYYGVTVHANPLSVVVIFHTYSE